MSNRKRNISYIKPQDPTFLREIKEKVGYKDIKETLELKRQKIENLDSDDNSSSHNEDREEEKPQVVVLKEGDLTAVQAEIEQKRITKEENEKPADLNQRVIFKSKIKPIDENSVKESSASSSKKDKKIKVKKTKELKNKLSFNDEEEEEEDNI